jgi:outer membrane protein OmpA-like peptidoglycan-associated protein
MNRTHSLILAAAVSALMAACTSTPDTIEELETARAVVPQVEASPRAGVAATNIAEARKALERANSLADKGGKVADIQYEATIASRNAQIANEKILAAQAREEVDKGTADRAAVLAEARGREAERAAQQARAANAEAQSATAQAQTAEERAAALERELADLKGKKTDRGVVVTLGDVLFDTGKATLKPGAYTTIDRLATVLKEDESRKVLIEGHTDSVGSDEFNQSLSERRAASVQAALFERGVAASQISTVGKGETTPVASNDDAGGRQQNRRVELVFQDDRSRVASDTD